MKTCIGSDIALKAPSLSDLTLNWMARTVPLVEMGVAGYGTFTLSVPQKVAREMALNMLAVHRFYNEKIRSVIVLEDEVVVTIPRLGFSRFWRQLLLRKCPDREVLRGPFINDTRYWEHQGAKRTYTLKFSG